MLQMFKVGAAASSLFVRYEVAQRNEVHGNAEEGGSNPASPRVCELNSRNVRENVYPNGSYPDLVHDVVLAESLQCYSFVLQWSAKFHKGMKEFFRIGGRVVDPETSRSFV